MLISKWPDCLGYGLTEEHIPELIRMATDPELNNADSESSEVWAPLHAWRAFGQLRAEQAIEPLAGLLNMDDDWVSDELPAGLRHDRRQGDPCTGGVSG